MRVEKAIANEVNIWGALVGWIDQPMKTMRYAIHHPRSWFAPALLITISMIALVIISAPMEAKVANERIAAQLSRVDIPEEQRAVVSQYAQNVTPRRILLTGIGGGMVVLALGWILRATVLHFSVLVLGGESQFPQMFAVVSWSWLPYFVRNIVQAVYIGWTRQLISNPGLSALVASGDPLLNAQNIWYVLLSSLDLFLLWHLLLSTLGISAVSGFSRTKSAILRIVWWLAFSAARLIPVLIGGALMTRALGA